MMSDASMIFSEVLFLSNIVPWQAPIFAYDRRKEQAHCVLYPDFTFGSAGWPLARIPSWEDFRFANPGHQCVCNRLWQ